MNQRILESFILAGVLIWVSILTIFVCDSHFRARENLKETRLVESKLQAEMELQKAEQEKEMIKYEQLITAIVNGKAGEW